MFNYIFRTQARSISRILKVSSSHPKVEVMLWSFLMLSTVATTAAVGCQVQFIPSRFDCILPDSTSTGYLPQRALYALSPMSIHPKDKWVLLRQILTRPISDLTRISAKYPSSS